MPPVMNQTVETAPMMTGIKGNFFFFAGAAGAAGASVLRVEPRSSMMS